MNCKIQHPMLASVLSMLLLPFACAQAQQPGELLWSRPVVPYTGNAPAIALDGTIYAGSLAAFTPEGSNKWTLAIPPEQCDPVVGSDGTIYIGSDDGNFYAVNPDGTVKWTFPAGGTVGSTPALDADGTIYFTSGAGKLFALAPDGTKNGSW